MTTRVGKWSLTAIETGDFRLDGGAMFGVVPKTLWSRQHPADESNRIDMTMRALLLRGEAEGRERVVLVDAGAGEKLSPKWESIYAVDYSNKDLLGSLASVGVTPAQVTDVIITHLHFDHCGGSTIYSSGSGAGGSGELVGGEGSEAVPTFPNAVYHIQRRQWEWALDPSERDRASYFPENFVPLERKGQLNLVEGEVELLPDVYLVVIDGHTPGQQIPLVHTLKRSVLFCADLFPTPSHVRLPYIMAYDLEPLKSLEEKKRVLPRAVEEEWVLFYEHDAHTECSFVEETVKGYQASEPTILEDCF